MEVTSQMVVAVVTAILTYIFGLLSKKFNWVESKYIPVQNILIGTLSGLVCYALNLSNADLLSSVIYCLMGSMTAGGVYDLKKTKGE